MIPNESRNSMIIEGGVFAAREAQMDALRKCTDLEKLRASALTLFRDLEDARYENQDLAQTLSHVRSQLAEAKLRAEAAEAEKSEMESKVQHLGVRLEQALKSSEPASKSLATSSDNLKPTVPPRTATMSSRVSQIGPFNSASTDSSSKRASTVIMPDSSITSSTSGPQTAKKDASLSPTAARKAENGVSESAAISTGASATASSTNGRSPRSAQTSTSSNSSTTAATTSSEGSTPDGSPSISKNSDAASDKPKDKKGKKTEGTKQKTPRSTGGDAKTGHSSATTSPRDHRSPPVSPRSDAPFSVSSSDDRERTIDSSESPTATRPSRTQENDENGMHGSTSGAAEAADGEKRKSNPFKRSSRSGGANGSAADELADHTGDGVVATHSTSTSSSSIHAKHSGNNNKDPFKSKPTPEWQNFIASDTEGLSRSPVGNPRLAIWNGPSDKGKRDRKRTGIDMLATAEDGSDGSSPSNSEAVGSSQNGGSSNKPAPFTGNSVSMTAVHGEDGTETDSATRRRTSSSSASGDYSSFGSKEAAKKHKKDKSGKQTMATGVAKGGQKSHVASEDIQTDVEGGGRNYRRGTSGDMNAPMTIVDPTAGSKRRPAGGSNQNQQANANRMRMGPSTSNTAYNNYHRHASREMIMSDHEGTYHSEKTAAKFRAIEMRRQAQQMRESTYGIAFGVRRGSCEPPCDCVCYVKRSDSYACGTCSHFPAQHLDMGQVSDDEEDVLTSANKAIAAAEAANRAAAGTPAADANEKEEGQDTNDKAAGTNAAAAASAAANATSTDVIPALLDSTDDSPSIEDHWRLNFSECFFVSQLGKGNSSTVFLGEYQGEEVAIKVLRQETHKRDLEDFKKEMQIMCSLRSPYIVHFYGATLAPKLCIVLEYCSRGTLFHYLHDDLNYVDWRLALRWLLESARGINTLHLWRPQIVHRDLKTLNLLLDEKLRIKVCDFGLSRYVSVEHDQSTFFKMRGTFAYFAPEVYQGKPFTSKSDVYSLGIILWEIVHRIIFGSHTRPFAEFKHINHDFQIIIQAAKGLRPTLPFSTPRLLVKLYDDCVAADPEARPTCQEIIERLEHITAFYEDHADTWDALVKGGVRIRPHMLRRRDSQNVGGGSASTMRSGVGDLSQSTSASPNRSRAELLRTPIASRNLKDDLTRRGVTASLLREKLASSSNLFNTSGSSSPASTTAADPNAAPTASITASATTSQTTTPISGDSAEKTVSDAGSTSPATATAAPATITVAEEKETTESENSKDVKDPKDAKDAKEAKETKDTKVTPSNSRSPSPTVPPKSPSKGKAPPASPNAAGQRKKATDKDSSSPNGGSSPSSPTASPAPRKRKEKAATLKPTSSKEEPAPLTDRSNSGSE